MYRTLNFQPASIKPWVDLHVPRSGGCTVISVRSRRSWHTEDCSTTSLNLASPGARGVSSPGLVYRSRIGVSILIIRDVSMVSRKNIDIMVISYIESYKMFCENLKDEI